MTCFARVASPYSLRNNLLVTLSHNFLLSVDSRFDTGLTILGTERNGARSISVVHSSSESLFLDGLLSFALPHAATTGNDQLVHASNNEDDEPPPSHVPHVM